MSGKRAATTELNDRNWDQEEKPEDKGVFTVASEDELKTRVIKKAKRKLGGTGNAGDDEAPNKSVFSGFSGFGKSSSTATTLSTSTTPFSFLSKISSTSSELSTEKKPDAATDTTKEDETDNLKTSAKADSSIKSSYGYAKLKALNQAVSAWIKKHVEENSLCILTPIFKDYENHLTQIRKEENVKLVGENPSNAMSSFKFSASSTTNPELPKSATTFSFSSEKKSAEPAAKPEVKNMFGIGSATSTGANIFSTGGSTGFSFTSKTDAPSTMAPATTGFSFASAKPFTFGNVAGPPTAAADSTKANGGGDNEDEEDEPPKVEFTPVVEEDSIFSKKVKVFVKNDGNFVDRGVGTLYLKPVKDQNRTQLLVRADTNLGNILLNIILNETVPTRRMGKNNVMLVCIPTPECEKPVQVLVRVKTAEEADEMLEMIDKCKV